MESPEEIIYHFWRIRNEYYDKRKKNICDKLSKELELYRCKVKFVNDIIEDKIVVFRQKLEVINKQLEEGKYTKFENGFKYLTDMKIHSFTEETITELTDKMTKISQEYEKYKMYSLRNFWMDDIQ